MRLQKIFASNVRQYRKAKKLRQWQLAELIGVGTKAISDYEVCRTVPSLETIEKIAKALDVPEAALFGGGWAATPTGSRGNLVLRINTTLSRMNETQLARAAKMLEAFAGE